MQYIYTVVYNTNTYDLSSPLTTNCLKYRYLGDNVRAYACNPQSNGSNSAPSRVDLIICFDFTFDQYIFPPTKDNTCADPKGAPSAPIFRGILQLHCKFRYCHKMYVCMSVCLSVCLSVTRVYIARKRLLRIMHIRH